MIIAIDGPAGAGKSTIAKGVSKEFNFIYISSGKIYRAIALYLLNNNIDIASKDEIKASLKYINISYENELLLNEKPVENEIYSEIISKNTSEISKIDFIREFVQDILREISMNKDIVMDGRDIGTVVFPNADYKFYLTASIAVRAKRRHKELKNKGVNISYKEIYDSIKDRDFNDMNREISPLKKAEDAIVIDSSDMSITKVIEKISSLIKIGED